MLKEVVEALANGIVINGFIVYSKKISKGRFREEVNLDVYLKRDEHEDRLIDIKVFYGRPPYHTAWVEFYDIKKNVNLGREIVEYFNSFLEDKLLLLFSQALNEGESIFVEYYDDEETRRQLGAGLPPPVSRLGYKLFGLGFTWFKDWYFAEGFWEGGIKLQGEKPNEESVVRQLKAIYENVKIFLEKEQIADEHEWYVIRAVVRAKNIQSKLKEFFK
ncbi:MAG: DUF1122 family protein [Candidatus Jordarchaeum sp.]|uniref:DUF1122 family protein n=1 Tax=Candidatus Jordarchaeum sp. TaxID=2823881 RepID=UPI00404A6E23